MGPRLQAAEPAAPPSAMVSLPYRVGDKRRETRDTWTLELEPEGEAIAPLSPGQFTMLYAFGAGEVPISTSADLTTRGPLVHTIRAVGAATRALCAAEPGDTVGVRGPFGTAWPVREAEGRDVVVLAGGIGLAPLRPVIHHVLEYRGRYGRLAILYSGRAPEELLYLEQLAEWGEQRDVSVRITVDQATPDWRGDVGVVTTLIRRAPFDARHALAMICGPEIMMRFTRAALRDRGMATEDIYVSLERSMKCAVGHCGHCQLGPMFVCKDGPVFRQDEVEALLKVREL
jgi:NAD(P)H-flavin reductase